MLVETGSDMNGLPVESVTSFHGNLTSNIYVSQTDGVLLQFCYRSETFSARNIQILYSVSGEYSK